jgi:hypothetical protein
LFSFPHFLPDGFGEIEDFGVDKNLLAELIETKVIL